MNTIDIKIWFHFKYLVKYCLNEYYKVIYFPREVEKTIFLKKQYE